MKRIPTKFDLEECEYICKLVANYFGITVADIKGKSRKYPLIFPRMMAIELILSKIKLTQVETAMFLGGRDHSTIIHSTVTFWNHIRNDESKKAQYENVLFLLKNRGAVKPIETTPPNHRRTNSKAYRRHSNPIQQGKQV